MESVVILKTLIYLVSSILAASILMVTQQTVTVNLV